jgi:DNA-binding MarR family transcriptional regulator
MTVSKTGADAVKPSRPARKAPVEAAVEDAALQLGELSELLGYSLKRAQLKVFEDFLRCMAPLQLTPAQFSVLLLLDRNPGRNQTEIANTLGILRPNFVAMLDGLESRDLCARMRSTNDRRSHILVLTDKGRGVLVRAKKLVATKHEARLNELLGPANRVALLEMWQDRGEFWGGSAPLLCRHCEGEATKQFTIRAWDMDCSFARNDGVWLHLIHQDHPHIVHVGERRSREQQIAGFGEERRGVVVVEIGFCVEAERFHSGKGGLIDHRAGGIAGATGATIGAVGIRRQG